jgi:hypothetical protein
MKYTISNKHEKTHGKKLFFLALAFLILIIICALLFRPPEFQNCAKGEQSAKCVCPAEQKYIGKRNIIFIDVTDAMSSGKVQDINRIISETALNEMGLLDWLKNSKKVDRTSIYLLSDKKPVEMEPIASYCSLPPAITWLASDFSENDEKRITEGAKKEVITAIKQINSQNSVTYSHIVEGLAVATSNSANWTSGSKLILISDLYENSSTCGYFETQPIPSFKSVGADCKKWSEILGKNLTKNAGKNGQSTVAICQILSKKPKAELVAFWRELFQHELGYDILLSCDPEEIDQRSKYLN